MKTLSILVITFWAFTITSCEEFVITDCDDGWGELCVENKSLHTVQKIIINGTSYGTLDPGDSECFSVPVGSTTLHFKGISGGNGCSPSVSNIPDCGQVSKSCSG